MPDALITNDWKIRLADGDTETVEAAYWTIDADTKWIEFKNKAHKCVFAIHEAHVFSVARS